MGFLGKLEEATGKIGKTNILEPKDAKSALEAAGDSALLLDVQDPGSDSIPGAYSCSRRDICGT